MRYFKVFQQIIDYFYHYYTINNQSIKILFSKNEQTNALGYEVDLANLKTISDVAKQENSVIIKFDSDAELLDDITKSFDNFYLSNSVSFYAWQIFSQEFRPYLVVKLPSDIILYAPKNTFQCSYISDINDLINFDHDYVKQYKSAKEALNDVIFKNYTDVLNEL